MMRNGIYGKDYGKFSNMTILGGREENTNANYFIMGIMAFEVRCHISYSKMFPPTLVLL